MSDWIPLTLDNLTNALRPVSNWDGLAVQLKVPYYRVQEIMEEFPKVEQRKRASLQFWLENTPDASWDMVINALKRIHLKAVAKRIETEFRCVQPPEDTSLRDATTIPSEKTRPATSKPARNLQEAQERLAILVNPQVEPPLDHLGGSDHNGSPTTSGVLTRRRHSKPDRNGPDPPHPQHQPHLHPSRYGRTILVCGALGFIITIVLLLACISYMPNFYIIVAVETDKEPLSTIWHHNNTNDSPHTVKSTDHDTATGTTIPNNKEPEQTQQAVKSNGAGCKPIENVNEVIDALSSDISDWKYLGEELGLTSTTLDRIKLDQHNELHKLKETIRTWYQKNPDNSCWEVIIRALTRMAMNRSAKGIADKQGLDWKLFKS